MEVSLKYKLKTYSFCIYKKLNKNSYYTTCVTDSVTIRKCDTINIFQQKKKNNNFECVNDKHMLNI